MIMPGDNLAELIAHAIARMDLQLRDGDILSLCQKIVSKAEGRLVSLKDIEPSPLAVRFAERWEKDPRSVELVLRQGNTVVDRNVYWLSTQHDVIDLL